MKKILLITLLLIPFLGISQTTKPIDGFLGIKFGSSKADVTAAMQAKGATVVNYADGSPNTVYFKNVKLGSHTADIFNVIFINDKAYEAFFLFKPEDEPHTIPYYDNLVKDISEVYGKGKATREFKSPYKDDGENVELAIEGGYTTIFTDWAADKKLIQASITSMFSVRLLYVDLTLQAEAKAAEKTKNKADF